MKCFDFHVHSKYSYDSIMSIGKMIKIGRKRGLSGLAIVDHDVFSRDKLKGDLKSIPEDFLILFGTEVKTDWGDLIALNTTEEVKSRAFMECVDETKEKDGISILVHPYRKHKLEYMDEMIDSVDWIEVWNARSTQKQNKFALSLKGKKPYVVGSDAHLYREIGVCKLGLPDFQNIDDVIRGVEEKKGQFEMKESPYNVHYYSSAIGTIKTGNYSDFFRGVRRKIGGRG